MGSNTHIIKKIKRSIVMIIWYKILLFVTKDVGENYMVLNYLRSGVKVILI